MPGPPKRPSRGNLPVSYDILDSLQAVAGPHGFLEPTALGLVVEVFFVLTWEKSQCPLSPQLDNLLVQCRLHLRQKLPAVLTELKPHLP